MPIRTVFINPVTFDDILGNVIRFVHTYQVPVLQIIVVTWSWRICLICMWQYAWSLRTADLTTNGYISGNKITSDHITSNMHQFWHSKNHPKLQLTALPIYIAMGSCHDYEIFILTLSWCLFIHCILLFCIVFITIIFIFFEFLVLYCFHDVNFILCWIILHWLLVL